MFPSSCKAGHDTPLPRPGLVLLLLEGGCFDEAAELLDAMISGGMLFKQARMLRGDLHRLSGDSEGVIGCCKMLLSTSHARVAAEKPYDLLFLHAGRTREAAVLFRKYLGGCGHY